MAFSSPSSHLQYSNALYQVTSHIGSEFTAKRVRLWLKRLDVKPIFIEPGSPWENGYIESFNGKMRDELLAREIFYSLKEAKVLINNGINLLKQLDIITGKKREYKALAKLDHKTISFVITSIDGFTLGEKQRFLEMTSTNTRITESVESLRKMVQKENIRQEIKIIIGGNGNLRRGIAEGLNK